jgi:chorismate-pyruvate lyase
MEDRATGKTGSPPARARCRSPVDVLTAALSEPGATVTEVLEDLVREPVVAHKLDQGETTAAEGNRLAVEPGHPLARRVTVLRGARSSRPYLYADTLIVTGRLPVGTWRRLARSNDPIGRVIVEDGLPLTRVGITPEPRSFGPPATGWIGQPIYARRYRLDIGSEPVMEIAEWFLPDLTDFLTGGRPG